MRRIARILLVSVGLALGLVFASFAFVRYSLVSGRLLVSPRFSVAGWLAALPDHLVWVAPFAALLALQPFLRAAVWRRALGAAGPREHPGVSRCYHALTLGGFVNNVLPGKLGLAASAWALRHFSGGSFTTFLSSLLSVKLLELAILVAVAGGLGWLIAALGGTAGTLGRVVLVGALALMVLGALAVGAAHAAPHLAARFERRAMRPRTARALAAVAQGLALLRSAPHLGATLLLAVLPVAAGALAYGVALAAVGGAGGPAGGALLLAALTFGQLTPGLPIGVGVHYLVCSWGARELGVSAQDAAALAALTHAATVAVNLLLGLVSALVQREALRSLLKLRRARVTGADLLAGRSGA